MCRFSLKMLSPHVLIIMLAVLPIPGLSQVPTDTASELDKTISEARVSGELDTNALKAKRANAENDADLAEEVKKAVLNLLDRAITFTDMRDKVRQEIVEVEKRVKSAPEQIKATEIELDKPLPTPEHVPTDASNMKFDQRDNHLMTLEAELADVKTNLNRLADQLSSLKDRPERLQGQTTAAKQRLAAIAEDLKQAPPADELPALVNARRMALTAEQVKLQTDLELYEKQLVNHDTAMALVTAARDLAARNVAIQEARVKSWQEEVQRLRQLEAKKELVVAKQAKKLAADLPPIVQKQYDVMIELGKIFEKITAEEAQIGDALLLKQDQLKELEADFALAKEQVEFPFQSEAIGLALREQRRTLPSMESFQRESNRRRVRMAEIRALLLELDRQRRELADLDKAVAQILESEPDLAKSDLNLIKTELRRLLGERRDIVKKLQTGLQRLFKNLQRLDFIEQQIASKAREEAVFLDEHLIWIRSAKGIGTQDLNNLPLALKWFLNPVHWWQTLRDLQLSIGQYPIQSILVGLISIFFICLRPWAHRNLSQIARAVYSVKTDSFALTLRALALTLRISAGWPLLMGTIGWQLGRIGSSEDFTFAVGGGLLFASQSLAGSLFLYEICWKNGVGKVHFKWPESVRRTLRLSLRWFIPLLVITGFTFTAVQTHNNSGFTDSLGRLAFLALMLGFFVWTAYFFRFSGELASSLKTRNQGSWLVRLRIVWYPLTLGVPLLLILLAGMGYYYSASKLYLRMGETIALILGLIIIKDLLLRWLAILQRRLVYEEIKRKKEAADQKESQGEAAVKIEGEAITIEEPEINLDQIYEKNQILMRSTIFFSTLVGLWLIWDNVLPALNILEEVKLWSYTDEIEGVRTNLPVTLDALMLAIIVAIVFIVAAKNLPGLFEIILLNRFSMDYGARHAFTTISRYIIIALGVTITFSSLGIRWSNLQWLIAALSVGLGFGLQEIVANFICGLIVLFERPFRIGDTVTIADISGTVTRIQIRATTIMDWDRKELIVPNKEFITGRLINWSLSDNIIRLKVPVGIAYGSDTELAESLLLKAAKANPLVMANPEPQAVFMGFGDNALNFELRVFINGINDWIPMLHKLNKTVDREFRTANVTISFPQRDVHLDQIGPLEVKVVSD